MAGLLMLPVFVRGPLSQIHGLKFEDDVLAMYTTKLVYVTGTMRWACA